MAVDLDAIETFVAEVVRTADAGPFIRVTLRGPELHRLDEIGPEDFVYLLLPPLGCDELTVGPGFRWADVRRMDPDSRPVGAYYTVVERRPGAGELVIDVLQHPDPGPAAAWALDAGSGSPVALWGPRTAWSPPPTVDRFVLAADETGLPALVRILDHLSSCGFGGRTRAVLEVGDQAFDTARGVVDDRVELCRRTDLRRSTLAERALSLVDRGRPYIWAGAERDLVDDIRTGIAASGAGLPGDQLSLTAYWSRSSGDT